MTENNMLSEVEARFKDVVQTPDLCSGKKNERPKADQNITRVPLPQKDPVYGQEGPLKRRWR